MIIWGKKASSICEHLMCSLRDPLEIGRQANYMHYRKIGNAGTFIVVLVTHDQNIS